MIKTARNVPFHKPNGAIPFLMDLSEGSVTAPFRTETV
jgi:hypothetical protein